MRRKQYTDQDVLSAARERVAEIYDSHDSVVVSFSGGKDSLVVLHLAREHLEREGRGRKVDVVFLDEEVAPTAALAFVESYRDLPWLTLRWLALPLHASKYRLGINEDYVQWDPARAGGRWVREPPPWAERPAPGDDLVYSQYDMDLLLTARYPGKVAMMTGIRAAESLVRLRAILVKRNKPHIAAPYTGDVGTPRAGSRRFSNCRPIYDWEENDVFRYLWERGIRYAPSYDAQLWAGDSLRVSTPLHAERAKRLGKLRAVDPALYAGVIRVWPDMLAQERYYRDLDRAGVVERYGKSFFTVRQYIREHIQDPTQREAALFQVRRVEVAARKVPHLFPPEHVLKAILSGGYKRKPTSVGDHRWKTSVGDSA